MPMRPIYGCPARNGGRHKRIPNPQATIHESATGFRIIRPTYSPSVCAHCGTGLPGRWLLSAARG